MMQSSSNAQRFEDQSGQSSSTKTMVTGGAADKKAEQDSSVPSPQLTEKLYAVAEATMNGLARWYAGSHGPDPSILLQKMIEVQQKLTEQLEGCIQSASATLALPDELKTSLSPILKDILDESRKTTAEEHIELEENQFEPSHEHVAKKDFLKNDENRVDPVDDVELVNVPSKKHKFDGNAKDQNSANTEEGEHEKSVKDYQRQNYDHLEQLQRSYCLKRNNEDQPPALPVLNFAGSSTIPSTEQEEPKTNGKESEARNNDEMDTDDGSQQMETGEEQNANGAGESNNETVNATTPEANCCIQRGLLYAVSNLICGNISGECRIREGDTFYTNGKVSYCAPCFENQTMEPSDRNKFRNEVHSKKIEEEIFTCVLCKKKWHKTCHFEKTGIAFTQHKKALFICNCFIGTREEMPTAESIKETLLSRNAEEDVNTKLKEMNLKKTDEEHVLIRELSYVYAEALITKTRFPKYTLDQFRKLYGTSIKYRKRTLAAYQKKEGKLQLFLMIFLQQYRNFQNKEGNNWQVLKYLDTVPHAKLPNGKLSGTIMNSVMYQLSRMGYDKAFLWAKPSQQGDDYVFNKHPSGQEMPDLNKLLTFYKKSFEFAQKAGEIEKVETFKEHFKDKKPITLFKLPMFDDSLWDIMINWADYTMEVEGLWKEGTPKHQQIMTVMTKYFEEHKEDNFFIVFKNNNDRIDEDEPEEIPANGGKRSKTANKMFSNRDEFLTLCNTNNWVFSDELHGAFSTAAFTKYYTDMKKKEQQAANGPSPPVPPARSTTSRKRRA